MQRSFFLYNNLMDKRNSYTKKFRQLRWKLMLSYTSVTVIAILVVGLIALGVGYFWISNELKNGELPYQMLEAAATEYVIDLQPMLNQSPPDQESIANWINRMDTTMTPMLVEGNVPVAIDAGALQVLIVDSEGVLLGASSSHFLGETRLNEFLDVREYPFLSDALQSVLAGEEGLPNWHNFTIPDEVIIVVPIRGFAEEEILGGLVLSSANITVAAFVGETTSNIMPSILWAVFSIGVLGTAFGFLAGRNITSRLDQFVDATLAWSQGDFTLSIEDASEDELGQLAQRLNHMAGQLQHLLDTRTQLMVVEERNRLARDLHDSAKQQAFAAAAQISAARKQLVQNPDVAAAHIEEAERLTFDLRKELTNLIQELRPAALEDKGLAAAVRKHAEDWSRQNEIEMQVNIQNERSVPLDVEQTTYRIIQEALANVARHSQARHAKIALSYTKAELSCKISDDGIGFDPEKKNGGFGIRSMQERANALGSDLLLESAPGDGTRIAFTILIEQPGKNEEKVSDE